MSVRLRTRLDRVVALLGAALIVVGGVVFLIQAGQSSNAPAQQATAPPEPLDQVSIRDFLFKPPAITVPVGTTITFTNEDAAPHTATSGASPTADGVFDTGILKQGQGKAVKLAKAGTFAYYCELHPFMKATVIVT